MFGTGVAGKALPTPKHTRPWISATFNLPDVAEQNPVIYGALLGSFPPLARGGHVAKLLAPPLFVPVG